MVFVLATDRTPLDPTTLHRAKRLLKRGRASVFRKYPFTIILHDRTAAASVTHPHRLKLDSGSKTTGIAVVAEETGRVVWAGELTHRGQQIRDRLLTRRASRRSRRQRKTRYRQPRLLNRRRPEGWLAPSLAHRVETTLTWVNRLRRYVPITALSTELVRFDTQLLENAEVRGTRQACRMDKYGFPRTGPKAARTVHGFRTGDLVRATVTTGKKAGTYRGRVAVRASGSFNLTTVGGTVQGLHYRFFTRLHQADGFTYPGGGASSHKGAGFCAGFL